VMGWVVLPCGRAGVAPCSPLTGRNPGHADRASACGGSAPAAGPSAIPPRPKGGGRRSLAATGALATPAAPKRTAGASGVRCADKRFPDASASRQRSPAPAPVKVVQHPIAFALATIAAGQLGAIGWCST